MIRKLNDSNHQALMDFVLREPAYNLFIIGDVEHFGYDNDFQELWAQFEEGQIIAILLRYRTNFILYAPGAHYVDAFANLMLSTEKLKVFSGKPETVCKYRGVIPFKNERLLYFTELEKKRFRLSRIEGISVKKASPSDSEDISYLRKQIPEFEHISGGIEATRQRLESGLGRTYFFTTGGIGRIHCLYLGRELGFCHDWRSGNASSA